MDSKTEDYQSVWLEFDDGTKAGFTGKASCYPGDTRRVVGIKFTTPKPLPEGCSFESIENERSKD